MPERPTWGERIQQEDEERFVGRQDKRYAFLRNLGSGSPKLLFAIHGQAGMGKSFLSARYQRMARRNGAATALTNETEAAAMEHTSTLRARGRLAEQLGDAGFNRDLGGRHPSAAR